MAAKYALGVTTSQMNKDHLYHTPSGDTIANQLATLEHLGIFTSPLPKQPDELPRLADPHDAKVDLNLRARSYLHANCAHCHRKWGGGNAEFELHASWPLTKLAVVNTPPGQGKFNLADPKVLVPGDPSRSMILHRMELMGLGRMPHVASRVVDRAGADLLREWLASLKTEEQLARPGVINPRSAP
jgi:mono/diheme cytochrome c family protein